MSYASRVEENYMGKAKGKGETPQTLPHALALLRVRKTEAERILMQHHGAVFSRQALHTGKPPSNDTALAAVRHRTQVDLREYQTASKRFRK